MNKKIIISIISLLLVGGIAYAWHVSANRPVDSAPIKVGMAVYPGFGTLYIAQEEGFFKKYGVNVEIVPLSLDAMFPALASGQVQMLVGSTDAMAIVADSGIPAKQIFSTSISNGADGIIVTSDVKSVSDLKGKTAYVSFGFPDHFFLRYVAQQAGLSNSDIKLVNLDADQIGSSFLAGKINYGATWEPWLSKASERPGGHVLVSSKDDPGIITDIVMARTDLIQNRRTDVENLMRGFFDAENWWQNNVPAGNAIVAKAFNLTPAEFAPMRDTVKLSDLQTNLMKFDKSQPLNVYTLAEAASQIYYDDGVIKATTTAEAVTDPSLLEDIANATHSAR